MEGGHYGGLHGGASEDAYCQEFLEDSETGFSSTKLLTKIVDSRCLVTVNIKYSTGH